MTIKGQPGEQLKMLMSAREITEGYQPLDDDRESHPYEDRMETDDEVWDRKAEEAYQSESHLGHNLYGNLYEHVQKHGVHTPVQLSFQAGRSGKPQVAEGHHRIAVMREVNPEGLIPVDYKARRNA